MTTLTLDEKIRRQEIIKRRGRPRNPQGPQGIQPEPERRIRVSNPGNRPKCPACDCPDMCQDTGRCDCVKHDCLFGWS